MFIDDIQDVLSVFSTLAVKIFLLRVGSQINKTTLAASQTGKRLFHNLYLFAFTLSKPPLLLKGDLVGFSETQASET